MACIRKRRGKWVVDYRDPAGVRRWVTCETRREAEALYAEKIKEARQHTLPAVDPDITVSAYAERWLDLIRPTLEVRSFEGYDDKLRLHILPDFGPMKVRQLARGQIKQHLAAKRARGLSRDSVRLILATLRAMLYAAVEDGVILANPAARLGRQLRLTRAPKARQEEIKAMTREQLTAFLEAAWATAPRVAPLFFTMARTGVRIGEALALQREDLNFADRDIRVARAFSRGELKTPKNGHGRTVDMSRQTAAVLEQVCHDRDLETLKRDWRERPVWVFCTKAGTPWESHHTEKMFKRVLKKAQLPLHFTQHCLRHTYASLLLQRGESPAYVQRQLGHASIELTVDTYGRWLPMGNKSAVDALDDDTDGWTLRATGSKVVATTVLAANDDVQVVEISGAPEVIRTPGPQIRSLVLYPAELRAHAAGKCRGGCLAGRCGCGVASLRPDWRFLAHGGRLVNRCPREARQAR